MPFIPVPNTCLVEMIFDVYGGKAENTLYFSKPEPWSVAALQTMAVNMVSWWVGNMQALTGQGTGLSAVRVTSLESQAAPSIEYPVSPALLGSAVSNTLPSNVTVTTTFLTGQRGRSFRGRNYFVGMPEGSQNGDTIDATMRDGLDAAYEALIANPPLPATAWVVVSKYELGIPRIIGIATPIIGVKGDTTIDSQRRRLTGRGA